MRVSEHDFANRDTDRCLAPAQQGECPPQERERPFAHGGFQNPLERGKRDGVHLYGSWEGDCSAPLSVENCLAGLIVKA